jgi:type II secretory pathway component PulC
MRRLNGQIRVGLILATVILIGSLGLISLSLYSLFRERVGSAGSFSQPKSGTELLRTGPGVSDLVGVRAHDPAQSPLVEPLSLKLLGIFKTQGESRAVIKDLRSKRSASYREGDSLPRQARLVKIELNRVQVRRGNGEDLYLYLESNGGRSPAEQAVTALSPTEFLVNRREMERQALPLLLELSQMKMKPQVEKGRLVGFWVRGAASEGFLEHLGIKEGDVIAAVNGESLKNYRKATELLGQALEDPSFSVTVVKGKGKERPTFTYYWTS